jgi:glycerol 3-phosphatase-2
VSPTHDHRGRGDRGDHAGGGDRAGGGRGRDRGRGRPPRPDRDRPRTGAGRRDSDRDPGRDRRRPERDRRARPGAWPEPQPRPPAAGRPESPEPPPDARPEDLDRSVRDELRLLPRPTADRVARHLVAAGRLLDEDPSAALAHAMAARRLAPRVGAVREAVGIAAYHAEDWRTAITELRAYQRITGRFTHAAVVADSERALGRPERAIDLYRSTPRDRLTTAEAVELLIVAAGARRDLGQLPAAVAMLQVPELTRPGPWAARLRYAYADALLAAGRVREAREWFARAVDADEEAMTDAAERLLELDGVVMEEAEDDGHPDPAPDEDRAGAEDPARAEHDGRKESRAGEADAVGEGKPAGQEDPAGPENPTGEADRPRRQGPVGEAGPRGNEASAARENPVGEDDPVPEEKPAGEHNPAPKQNPAGEDDPVPEENPGGEGDPAGQAGDDRPASAYPVPRALREAPSAGAVEVASPPRVAGGTGRLADAYDVVVLDLDGVVYLGEEAVPGAVETVTALREAGIVVRYATNNASRDPVAVADLLSRLGIPADPAEVLTSAMVAAERLARTLPPHSTVLVVGSEALAAEVRRAGLRPVRDVAEDGPPAAVVQGYAPDVGWRDLAEVCVAVRRGAVWVATNTDATLPSPRGPLPGNGALVAAVRHALGRGPDVVAGKPDPAFFEAAARHGGSGRVLVVGDRLDTDVDGAVQAGLDSLLVLTGVATRDQVDVRPPDRRPTYVAPDLTGLLAPHPGVA